MGKPTRPNTALTYDQMVAYESSHTKWFTFYGYVTHIHELAEVFKINHITLVKRIEAGWAIESALSASTTAHWTRHTIQYYQNDPNTTAFIQSTLDSHFNPKKQKIKKGNKKVKKDLSELLAPYLEDRQVIDGGFYA
jgi:hypothetical protein